MPILFQGTDCRGTVFQLAAETHDISGSGAFVSGLIGICSLDSKVEIEFRSRKAIYRAQWLGEKDSPRAVADAKHPAPPPIASSPIPVAIPPVLPAESHSDSPTVLAQALDAVVVFLCEKAFSRSKN